MFETNDRALPLLRAIVPVHCSFDIAARDSERLRRLLLGEACVGQLMQRGRIVLAHR